ncbi:hypothetical protein [Caulobacter mirabilis]|uniref:Uncharacterized protein n=1 Tax=Caulobacter mirabilis TaxID=69666 RepID=A0A2D2AYN6_9CAUL|nr:hypothetical protein [Caulobacter mirabilis]ATQ43128.1 hypothetical protein CSW64_12235 [Caulobacter mirabilis]
MRSPKPVEWLFGNPASALVLTILAATGLIGWFLGQVPFFLAAVGVVAGSYAFRAANRVNAYTAWKREWDAMGGARRASPPVPRRIMLGVAAWCVLAWLAVDSASDPAMQGPVALFWLGSAALVVIAAVRWAMKKRPKPQPRSMPVAVCVSGGAGSPSVASAMAALPAHLTSFIAREPLSS